ncbi:MAG: ice-binding family protein, partial [Candidatus Dormiibacterota bacterium]
MSISTADHATRSDATLQWCGAVIAAAVVAALVNFCGSVGAASVLPTVDLGSASAYGVLAGTTVTNTGLTNISGTLGVNPGTAITGFPPGVVSNGTIDSADASAAQAQSDLTTAYGDAVTSGPATPVAADLGGMTLDAGIYTPAAQPSMFLTGTVTLDGQGNPNAVFIFQAGSTLVTASDSLVNLIGNAQACNVFWQVGSSATLGTGTDFSGSILALTSITVSTGASVEGRLLAQNGAVTLD